MNGLRIGRHPSNQVDWNEINAALGDVLLLLATVGFNFSRYVLLPMGNYSKLRSVDDQRVQYYLYSDDSFSLLPKRNFNQAMCALLTCAKELGSFVEEKDPALRYPYLINNDKINLLSGMHTSNEERWTKAMKFLLTDLKWAVAWTVKHSDGQWMRRRHVAC